MLCFALVKVDAYMKMTNANALLENKYLYIDIQWFFHKNRLDIFIL